MPHMPNPPDTTPPGAGLPTGVTLAAVSAGYLDALAARPLACFVPQDPKVLARVTRLLLSHLPTVMPGECALAGLTEDDYGRVLGHLRDRGCDDHTCQEVFGVLADLNAHACRQGLIDVDRASPVLDYLRRASNGRRPTPTRKRLGGASAFQKLIRDSVIWAGSTGKDI